MPTCHHVTISSHHELWPFHVTWARVVDLSREAADDHSRFYILYSLHNHSHTKWFLSCDCGPALWHQLSVFAQNCQRRLFCQEQEHWSRHVSSWELKCAHFSSILRITFFFGGDIGLAGETAYLHLHQKTCFSKLEICNLHSIHGI